MGFRSTRHICGTSPAWLLLVFCGIVFGHTVINATNSEIQIMGRHTTNSNGSASLDWTGVEVAFLVTGTTSVSVQWNGLGNAYNVFINGTRSADLLWPNTGQSTTYLLASSLQASYSYHILLTKRTEAQNNPGPEVFESVLLDDGAKLLSLPSPSNRRLEFLGASITCAYGLLSTPDQGPMCKDPQGRAEDSWVSYGILTARHFQSQVHVESWTGKGLLKNYGDTQIPSLDPFPVYFNRTLGVLPTPVWSFDRYIPQGVVIELGTNDYSEPPTPTPQQFEEAFHQFLSVIRGVYGSQVSFFLVCGPMSGDLVSCPYVMNIVNSEANTYYVDWTDILSDKDWGVRLSLGVLSTYF